jgi:hypothetical protein
MRPGGIHILVLLFGVWYNCIKKEVLNMKKVLNWCYKAYGNKEPNNWLNGVAIAFMVLVALS